MSEPEVAEKEQGLYPKLAEAIAEVDRVSKDGTNAHFNYKFTSAEEIYRVIRGPLLSRGLVLLPSVTGSTVSNGTTFLNLKFTLIDSETGETVDREWVGEGQDKGDKGPYKAMTGGAKTFLRHLFMLPADDDPEADPSTDRPPAAKKKAAPKNQRVADLIEGMKITGLTFGEIKALLAEVDAKVPQDSGDVQAALEALKPEQADELLAKVQARADDAS